MTGLCAEVQLRLGDPQGMEQHEGLAIVGSR